MGELPLNQIIHGDCSEVMQGFPDNSVDLVVTDPPYGLGFMGKEWDKALPPQDAFVEMYRVLKPGALAFVMSSPRQDVLWRMLALLEGVGFELRQSHISWIYKTGFPKAYDVSKGIDRKFKERKEYYELAKYLKDSRIKSNQSIKEIAQLFPSKSGGLTGCVWNWENTKNVPTNEQYAILKKKLNLDDRFDWLIEQETKKWIEAKRKILVERTMIQGGGHSYELRLGERREVEANITAPNLDLAKRWEGWKSQTGLKPALECILMVNKPRSEKTIVDNVLRWGTGAINVDSCRIPMSEAWTRSTPYKDDMRGNSYNNCDNPNLDYPPQEGDLRGRFPANLIVSDDALDDGEITKSGDLLPHHNLSKDENGSRVTNVYGKYTRLEENFRGDEGGKSRYFDLDAWAKHHGFLDVAKSGTWERDFGLKGKNVHPTVKPIKLMIYLIELGCPKNGVVLDPFAGSGTTCIAAKRLCRRYIGIELDKEYHVLAKSRLAAYPQPLEWFTQ